VILTRSTGPYNDLNGSLGLFQVASNTVPEAGDTYRGVIVHDHALLRLKLLDEEPGDFFDAAPDGVSNVVGATEAGGVLLTGCRGTGSRTNWGPKASTWYADFESAFAGVDLTHLRTTQPLGLSLDFYGLVSWYRLNRIEPAVEYDDDQRPRRLTITVESIENSATPLANDLELMLGSNWASTGEFDQRTVNSPVTVTLRSGTPRPLGEYVGHLKRFEDLMSLVYEDDIRAESGQGLMDYAPTDRSLRRPAFWNRDLMGPPVQDRTRRLSQVPYFSPESLGETEGVARWLAYCQAHPTIVNSIVGQYRNEVEPVLGSLLEVASAIEHWVVAEAGDTDHFMSSFLGDVGGQALTWLRAPRRWRLRFIEIYNAVKHGRSEGLDRSEIREFTHVARFLLRVTVLRKVAQGDLISAEMIDCIARNEWMTRRLRERFAHVDLSGQEVNTRDRGEVDALDRLVNSGVFSDDQVQQLRSCRAGLLVEATVRAGAPPAAARKWWTTELSRRANEAGVELAALGVTPEQVASVQALVDARTITDTLARQVFYGVLAGEGTPAEVVAARGLAVVSDDGALLAAVDRAIAAQPGAADKIRGGKPQAAGPLIGAVMKEMGGKAEAARVRELVGERVTAG